MAGMEPNDTEADPTVLLEQYLAVSSDECPLCGYNLHRLRGSTCPECGWELELRIAVREPRRAAFYAGLVGLAAGAGFALLLTGFALVVPLIRNDVFGPELWEIGLLCAKGIVLLTLCLLWIRSARWIQRRSTSERWLLAIGAWVLTISAVFIFFLVFE